MLAATQGDPASAPSEPVTVPPERVLARLVREFAALPTHAPDNDAALTKRITEVSAANPPYLHAFANGLELDRAAVNAGLTTPHHNGRAPKASTHAPRES